MRAFLFFLVKAHVHGHYRTINGIKKWIDPYEDKRPSAKPKIKTKGKDRKIEDLFDPRMSGDLYDPVAVREARKQAPAKPEKPKTVPVLFVRPDQPDLFGEDDLAIYSKMRNTDSDPNPKKEKPVMQAVPEKLESTGYTATFGEYVGRAHALLSKNGKTVSIWDDTPAEPLPEPLKAAVRAAGGDPATRVMVRERALGINMAIEKDFFDQIKVAIAAKQAELDAQPERIMAKLVAQRKRLAAEVGYIVEAAHEDHVRRVKRMSATGVGGKPKRDYEAEEKAAREALAKFDAEHQEVLEKIKADKKADIERNMWN
jgi:hypothetical protein